MSELKNVIKALGIESSVLWRLRDGFTIAEFKGIDEGVLEAIYSMAVINFQSGKLREAEQQFFFLFLHNHSESKFLVGLAVCRFEMGFPDNAIGLLKMALGYNDQDCHARAALGRMLLSLGRHSEAVVTFDELLEVAKGRADFKKDEKKIEAFLKSFKENSDV